MSKREAITVSFEEAGPGPRATVKALSHDEGTKVLITRIEVELCEEHKSTTYSFDNPKSLIAWPLHGLK